MITSAIRRVIVTIGFLVFSQSSAQAEGIESIATSLGGNSWRYDYTITNSTPSLAFDEVTIYFDHTKYSNLRQAAVPSGWDPFVAQPDTGIPADGYFDVLNLGMPLAAGEVVSGFSITFDLFASAAPAGQPFDVLDSSTFELINSGMVVLTSTSPVPEPGALTMMLMGMGLVCIAQRRARTSRSQITVPKFARRAHQAA